MPAKKAASSKPKRATAPKAKESSAAKILAAKRANKRVVRDEVKISQELPKFERLVKNLRAYGATQSELQRILVSAYHVA